MQEFQLRAPFQPTGDQPRAIGQLTAGVRAGLKHQVLLGVTGSGKTFTMANVIAKLQRPTLIISHNKTLAAQLYQEYRDFFPQNAVEYFVSYYDYYQPEAYLPQTDTYIEKDAGINENIDRLRLSATTSLMTRRDVVVVASVSCIYNLGSPQEYLQASLKMRTGMPLRREDLITRLVQLFYERSNNDFKRGTFRVRGERVDVYPAYLDYGIRLELSGKILKSIQPFHPVTGNRLSALNSAPSAFDRFALFPAKHYMIDKNRRQKALAQIRRDLKARVQQLQKEEKGLEAYRLEQKTNYDLELIKEIGYCKGIENYSRYFDGRAKGDPPYTLLDFFNSNPLFGSDEWLLIIDESHMSLPQIRAMFAGDRSRKQTLVDYGFRLPSSLDNRPLRFEEFLARVNQVVYTSATPGQWELQEALKSVKTATRLSYGGACSDAWAVQDLAPAGVVEQLIRPTGLLDPRVEIRGAKNQVENLITEIKKRVKRQERVLVTTLTKRMAEDLADFLGEQGIKVHYLHADVNTLVRTDILEDLRRGNYDVVVGINLLREGLDLPEVSLVAILDADKEGFLRSSVSLIQTMGRAARHERGRVILYADQITGSIRQALDEVNRRRRVQEEYNQKHGIKSIGIRKPIREKLIEIQESDLPGSSFRPPQAPDQVRTKAVPDKKLVQLIKAKMQAAAANLEFEQAAFLRDQIADLESKRAVKRLTN